MWACRLKPFRTEAVRRPGGAPTTEATALLPDRGQPLSVGGILAMDQIEVGLLQFLGNRAAAADTYLTAVHFANRGNLGGGAGEEGLGGDVHLITGDALLDHRNTQLPGQGEDGGTGDAVQAGGHLRGVDHAVLDDEDVLTG